MLSSGCRLSSREGSQTYFLVRQGRGLCAPLEHLPASGRRGVRQGHVLRVSAARLAVRSDDRALPERAKPIAVGHSCRRRRRHPVRGHPRPAHVEPVRHGGRGSKAGLTIQLHSHACLEVSYEGFTLLTDPWLDGPAFLGAWAPYPPPDASGADLRPDAILITHEHSDHFHEPTLQLLRQADAGLRSGLPQRAAASATGGARIQVPSPAAIRRAHPDPEELARHGVRTGELLERRVSSDRY